MLTHVKPRQITQSVDAVPPTYQFRSRIALLNTSPRTAALICIPAARFTGWVSGRFKATTCTRPRTYCRTVPEVIQTDRLQKMQRTCLK